MVHGPYGQIGPCALRFAVVENKHDTESVIIQFRYTVVKTVQAQRGNQGLVTLLNVQVSLLVDLNP